MIKYYQYNQFIMIASTSSSPSSKQNLKKTKWIRIQKINKEPKMILTPISPNKKNKARIDYEEQMHRTIQGHQHMWDDSKYNTAIPGDIFAYVENSVNNKSGGKTDGAISIYLIEDISSPKDRLESWSNNVGQQDRNVIKLGSNPLFEGTMTEWKMYMKYSERYCIQGTIVLSHEKVKQYIEDKKII